MRPSLLAVAAACLLTLAACSAPVAPTATPARSPGTAEAGAIGRPTAVACAPGAEPRATTYPGWPVPGRALASGDLFPYIVSSQVVAGPNRFLFTLIDSTNTVLAAADVPVTVAFFDLAADPATPVATVDAAFIDPGAKRGLYRAGVDFRCHGEWGIQVTAALPAPGPGASPRTITAQAVFDVRATGTVPAIGDLAPRSETPVATSPEELAAITTDDDPDPDFYRMTVAQAVSSGKPSAILFATPLFCQTATCGPMLDLVESVAADFKGKVEFVNVEPYRLRQTSAGLQPELDADGRLQTVPALQQWGLVTEPYLFVVDAQGRIAASFEGLLGEDEVRAALIEVSGG